VSPNPAQSAALSDPSPHEPGAKDYLRPAVHNSKTLSKEGLMERLFTSWFSGFVYNQIWEDPRVDLEALELNADSEILTISSGGCNILNYLVHEPKRIVAVDMNRHHIYLARLKLAAARSLPDHESFFQFFGCGDEDANVENYFKHVRPHLDGYARKYWEGKGKLRVPFRGPRINYFKRGFYNESKLGMLLRSTHLMSRLLRKDQKALLKMGSLEEQRAFYDKVVDPFFNNRLIRAIGKMPLVGFSLGIPPNQHKYLLKDCDGQIVDLYRDCARKLICDFPIEDNYFAWQAMSRSYDREQRKAIPDYLQEDNFHKLQQNVDRVETHITTLTHYLQQQPDNTLDRFVFLDSQDWMSPEQLTELWTEVDRVGRPGTRIIFRTASSHSPIETGLPAELLAKFNHEVDRGKELHKQDRSAIYGGFQVYAKPK